MARKKIKVKVNGMEISGSYYDISDLETVYTLAALQQRSIGHLMIHEKYMGIALDIKRQLTDALGELNIEKFD